MKRINEEANRPFKSGDVRQDGYIFKSYKLTLGIKKEWWLDINHLIVYYILFINISYGGRFNTTPFKIT